MKNVVTVEWLLENMNDNNLIILDCRYDMGNLDYGVNEYKKSHIKNAHFINLEEDLTGEKSEHGGRHPMPDMNSFAKKMESLGVNDISRVIIYDDGDIAAASRLWWMFKYIGKKEVYVLEGGFRLWLRKGLEVVDTIPEVKSKGKLSVNIQPEMRCDVDCVRENIGKENAAIVDSRSKERYRGIVEPIDKKAGHIPGAVNYFWQDILDKDKLKDLEVLKEKFKELEKYDKLIVHCGSGITACPNILVMDELGLKPIHYAGGWSDWISYDENQIVTDK
jgi:thiosulfate/3-mercaptopyruvate sulfurtransferase